MAKSRRPQPKGNVAQPDIGLELGVPNFAPTASWLAWSGDIPEGVAAIGRDPIAPSMDELVFMLRRDGQAQAMLNLLTLPIRAAFSKGEWIAPPNSTGGQEEVDFANLMWNLPSNAGGMKVSKSLFLRQSLLALAHGFSAFELVKEYRETGPLAGKYVIDKLAYRDPRTVTFLADLNGNYRGIRQRSSFAGRFVDAVIDAENSWYFAANEEHNPLYGVSYFEPAFQHYQMKRKLYYIGHLAAQMAAVPGRIGKIPLGASTRQIQEFKKGLAELHFNQAMLVPPNFEVTPFNGNSGFDFIKIIDHHNTQMAASILAKFLQQEDRQVLIDNGKADASADMFVQLLEAITDELAESWSTKLMPQFIDYNFTNPVYPVFRFAPLTDTNKQAIIDLFKTIVGLQQINCTPEFVRENEMKLAEQLGFDIDYEKVAVEEEKFAQEQQKAAEEAQQQAQQQAANPAQPQGANSSGNAQQSSGANRVLSGKGSLAPTPQGGRPPVTKLSAKKQEAMDLIALALTELIDPEDVPEDFAPEGETLPEAQED